MARSLLLVNVLAATVTAARVPDRWPPSPPPRGPNHVRRPFRATVPPHPAVARIVVPERGGTAYGSGTLIDTRDDFGLVLTNWHVVRDAVGTIMVVFPSGFRSAARALKVDHNWDLAALVIWRPRAVPVRLASLAPQPGEPLAIAGYGRGDYRLAVGRCVQYVAPGVDSPYEMVEVGVAARQGDSGGPILNQRGELAGVLFGSGGGTTTGAFCGRIGGFLASLGPNIGRRQPEPVVVAVESPPSAAKNGSTGVVAATTGLAEHPLPPSPRPAPRRRRPPAPEPVAVAAVPGGRASGGQVITWRDLAGDTPLAQAKTVLAAVGGLSLLLMLLGRPAH